MGILQKIKTGYLSLSFPKKLSCSMILITCLMAVYLTFFAFFSALHSIRQFSWELADSYASNICKQLENHFSAVTQTTTGIIQLSSLRNAGAPMTREQEAALTTRLRSDLQSKILTANASHGIHFSVLNIYLKNGYTYTHYPVSLPFTDYQGCKDYYTASGYLGESYSSAQYVDILEKDSGRNTYYVLLYLRPIYSPRTYEQTGFLLCGIDEADFLSYYESLASDVMILENDRYIVSHNVRRDHIGASYPGDQTASSGDYILRQITHTNLSLVIPNSFYWSVGKNHIFMFGASMVLIIFCGILMAVFFSRKLSKTLSDSVLSLKNFIVQVTRGDMDARYTSRGRDEIAFLGNHINTMLDQIQASIRREEELEKAGELLELRLMQSQINPHLLYNTLESVLWLMESDQKTQALELLTSLSGFFRLSLSKGSFLIPLKNECKLLEHYMTIQRLAHSREIQFQIRSSIDWENIPVIKFTLQPIIENSIIHGFFGYDQARIELQIDQDLEDIVTIQVTDYGIGILPEELVSMKNSLAMYPPPENLQHFGLYNVNRRIKSYFGEAYGLTLDSEFGEYTTVALRFPCTSGPESFRRGKDPQAPPWAQEQDTKVSGERRYRLCFPA